MEADDAVADAAPVTHTPSSPPTPASWATVCPEVTVTPPSSPACTVPRADCPWFQTTGAMVLIPLFLGILHSRGLPLDAAAAAVVVVACDVG